MAATRQKAAPALEIWQDLDNRHDAQPQAHMSNDVETALLNALGPLNDASNKSNVQLSSSTNPSRPGSSPSKKASSPLRPSKFFTPSRGDPCNVRIPARSKTSAFTGSLVEPLGN